MNDHSQGNMLSLYDRRGPSDVRHTQERRIRTKANIQQQLREPTPRRHIVL